MELCSSGTLWFLSYINENVLLQCITTVVFLCAFLFIYIIKAYTFFSRRHIPEGRNPTFPFGSLKDVLFQDTTFYEFLWKTHHKFKKKGHKYGGVYLFLKPGILVTDTTLMNRILSDENYFTFMGNDCSSLDYTKIIRILNTENLNNFLNDVDESSIRETLNANLLKNDFESILRNFFVHTTSLAFGFNIHEILNEVNDELRKKTESSFYNFLSLIYPIFRRKKTNTDLKDILEDIFEARKKNDIREHDLIQEFVDIFNEDKCEINEIATEVFQIFIENLVYSYSVTSFCLFELATNTDIQEELTGELRRFKKEGNALTLENISKLRYLDSVVKETLRKYPPVQFLLMRNKDGYKLTDDLIIQKDISFIFSIFGIHYDSSNFMTPNKFDPDRFLEDNKENGNIFMPFGFGKRSKFGMIFTTLNIKLGLMSILSSFRVRLDLSSTNVVEFDSKYVTVQPKDLNNLLFETL